MDDEDDKFRAFVTARPKPLVTVVLPIYNTAAWVGAAIESILHQSLQDLEIVAIDDGSTDATSEVVARYADPRIRLVRKSANQGLVAALNDGIDLARGHYIARMDADDVCHPRRLELQIKFMAANPEVGICGSWFRLIRGRWDSTLRTPAKHDDISARLFFRSPFGHPTIVFRTAFLSDSGMRYDPASPGAEDFDFWVRARSKTRFANVPRVLLYYRVHGGQTTARSHEAQSNTEGRIRLQQLADLVPSATDSEKLFHLRVSVPHIFSTKADLMRARQWLEFLAEANRKAAMFRADSFAQALTQTWAYCCLRSSMAPHDVAPLYLSRRFTPFVSKAFQDHLWTVSKIFLRPLAS